MDADQRRRDELIRLGEKYINNAEYQDKLYGPGRPYDARMPVLQAIRSRNRDRETRDLPVNPKAGFNRDDSSA